LSKAKTHSLANRPYYLRILWIDAWSAQSGKTFDGFLKDKHIAY